MSIIGKKAPQFCTEGIVDGQIQKIALSEFESRYKVLFFYPLDFTFVCPTELHAFQQEIERFKERNTQIIACSVDSVYSHAAWLRTPKKQGGICGVTYPLLADITKSIARAYGVLDEEQGVALRGIFVIDDENTVQCALINNLPIGRSIAEVLRLIDAVQYAKKSGQVCPANWQQGERAIVPNDEGLAQYFQR